MRRFGKLCGELFKIWQTMRCVVGRFGELLFELWEDLAKNTMSCGNIWQIIGCVVRRSGKLCGELWEDLANYAVCCGKIW